MPNLLQAVKFENKPIKLLEKENDIINNFGKVIGLYKQSVEYLGETPELKNKINEDIKNSSLQIRNKYWEIERKLPKLLEKIPNCDGEYSDNITQLNQLPKVKISEYRTLANIFNMVIIPIEYTEIYKLFDLEINSLELKSNFNYFKKLINSDTTTNYQLYILCPINYYNVWEQIKSNIIKEIYYPEYFDNIFQTLDLLIPTQKNLYLATKTNNENIKLMAQTFNVNIETLNNKINNISDKLNKLENDFLKEKQKNRLIQMNLQDNINGLENIIIKQQKEIEYLYCRLDPILFAIPENTNINSDNVNSIVGLYWGKDIDEIIFELKGVKINHNDLGNIYSINNISKNKINGDTNIKENKIDNKIDNDKIFKYNANIFFAIRNILQKIIENKSKWIDRDFYGDIVHTYTSDIYDNYKLKIIYDRNHDMITSFKIIITDENKYNIIKEIKEHGFDKQYLYLKKYSDIDSLYSNFINRFQRHLNNLQNNYKLNIGV